MGKPSKYRAKPTIVDGIRFASKLEAKRYGELRLLRSGQLITDITLQPKFPIICNGVKICDYIADFSYVDHKTGALTVEDTKGFATPVYRLKKRLFAACYPALKLVEIKA